MIGKFHETIRTNDAGKFFVFHHYFNNKDRPTSKVVGRNLESWLDAAVFLKMWIKEGRLYDPDPEDVKDKDKEKESKPTGRVRRKKKGKKNG